MKSKPVILIIDDDELLCSLLATMLYTRNVEVLSANTLGDANKILRNTSPLLVFLDNNLPDGQGIDYISKLKSDCKTEVIMITGNDDEKLEGLAMSKGCFGFLQKPFSYRSVSELVDSALKNQTGWYSYLKRQYENMHLSREKK